MRAPILLTALLVLPLLGACQPTAEAPADAPAAEASGEPLMPADAPPQEDVVAPAEASSTACTVDQGSDAAIALATRCTRVSPASHPPCNPENPCQLIQDEIDRSCAQYADRPAECAG